MQKLNPKPIVYIQNLERRNTSIPPMKIIKPQVRKLKEEEKKKRETLTKTISKQLTKWQ